MSKMKIKDLSMGLKIKLSKSGHARLAAQGYYQLSEGEPGVITYLHGNQINATFQKPNLNLGIVISDIVPISSTREELEKELIEAQATVDAVQAKLDWMNLAKVDVYSENEFKVWQTLDTIENKKMSKIDKARAIAALIEN